MRSGSPAHQAKGGHQMKKKKRITVKPKAEPVTRKTKVHREHKDTLFRMLFREKDALLALYNALNRTEYTDTSSLEITTLEDAVYMNYKNDISFVFDFELMLYEHQSTVNPNMPFRDLVYVTKILQGRTARENLYSSVPVRIPSPRFIVFYNGTRKQPEIQTLKLSALYEKEQEYPDLELTVTVYNINHGQNRELMECCHDLKEYAQFVEKIREYAGTLPIAEAVDKAVDYCIRHNILYDFLLKHRSEVIEMCLFEYDEELHMKSVKEEGIEEGIKKGIIQGMEKGIDEGRREGLQIGENRLAKLLGILKDTGRTEELDRAISDPEYRMKLYKEFQIDTPGFHSESGTVK